MTRVVRFGRCYPQRQHGEKRDPPDEHVDDNSGDPNHHRLRGAEPASCLLELDERSTKILRVQKKHRLVMSTEARLAIAEHSRAFRPQPIPRLNDIVDLVADVMHPPRRIAIEKSLYR